MPRAGRRGRLIERARAQVAEATGCVAGEVVFTSGATEAAAMALAGRGYAGSAVEHPCVAGWIEARLPVDARGRVEVSDPAASVLQAANSETGVVQELPEGLACVDAVQAVGRMPFGFDWTRGADRDRVGAQARGAEGRGRAAGGAGGGGGAGAARRRAGDAGGGPGTENVIGIAGFGAAIEAAAADLARGVWDEVAEVRNILEEALASAADTTIFSRESGVGGCRTRASSRCRAGRARHR